MPPGPSLATSGHTMRRGGHRHRVSLAANKGEEPLMAEYDNRFCPVCQAAMEYIARYYVWRCPEHGLFHHHQLEPHEQIKIGEFTWIRKNGETYVDRPAYPG